MTDLRGALSARLGPLPTWAWGVIGAGAIIGGRSVRARLAAAPAPVSDAGGEPPDATAPETGSSPTGGRPSLFATPANPYTAEVGDQAGDTTPAPAGASNAAWKRSGEQWALDNLQWSGIVITSALQRYLDGSPLSYSDASIVNSVIRAIGPAPEGAPEVILQPGADAGNAPTPPNTSPTPAPVVKTVTVPDPPITLGDRGEKVKALQRELVAMGISVAVDGVYGKETRAGVLKLQQTLGMANTTGRQYGPEAAKRLREWKLAH